MVYANTDALIEFFEQDLVGVHHVSVDGLILLANRADSQLLGHTADEYIGRPISDFHADPDVSAEILSRLLRDYPARLRHKNYVE